MALKVSIITPSFNQGSYIEKTIESVVRQQYPDVEYIIIDGGSTDESVNIIKRHEKNISYWISEPDSGQSSAVNKGLKIASGDIIGWINSDDIYYENALQNAVHVFMDHPEVDIVFGNVNFVDEKGNVLHRTNELPLDFNMYLFTERCYHANVAGFFRKRCFEMYGMLDENLVYGMDYELYLRFAINQCKFFQLKDVLGAYRMHPQSKTYVNMINQVEECKLLSDAYKKKLGINPVFYLPLKYLYILRRIIKKIFIGAYTPLQLAKRFTFRSEYYS